LLVGKPMAQGETFKLGIGVSLLRCPATAETSSNSLDGSTEREPDGL
jgi:hypothetical protein